jgi:hypothetical protein
MKKMSEILSLWRILLVASILTISYLITVNLNDAIAIYRTSWPPYKSDGCIILNLHWSQGEITLNSLKTIHNVQKRGGRKVKISPFYYTLDSKDGVSMKAEYIKVPRKLHYDYFDESTGELRGGQLERDEVDFSIRVPNLHKANQIRFYKTNRSLYPYASNNQKMLLERSDNSELIGEVNILQ